MDSPGYIVLSRLAAQNRATQVLANNLANADTPGFRAERAIFAPFIQRQRDVYAAPGGVPVAYALDRATWRETSAGPAASTGNPLDITIQGEGYLVVQTPRGERYTRAGRLSLDEQRQLVDLEGDPVLNEAGQPIAFAAGDTRIEIQGNGSVRTENGTIGRLRIVRFENDQALKPEGDRRFASDTPPLPVATPKIVQGALEGSNVRPVIEMTRLTEEVREFQNVATFAERESERQRDAVDRILRRR